MNNKDNASISIVLPSAFGTGGIKVLYEYGRRLSNRGYKVTYYVPIIAYNMHRRNIIADRIKQIYASLYMLKEYYIKRRIQAIRAEEQADIRLVFRIKNRYLKDADIVIASAWVTAFDVVRLSEGKGDKWYFIQGYEIWDNKRLGKKSYGLPLKKIAIAKWIKERLVVECGCDADEIAIVNNGIDIDKYNNPQKHYDRDLGIRCLMLDHRLRQKGVREGLEAFRRAQELYPQITLTMFGMKKSADVPDWVDYYQDPTHDTLISLYRESDVFIFPSLEDGWGLTPIEAMACKCAVVGTSVGCMTDIGKHGENVLLSEPGDINGMVNNLVIIINDYQLRRKLSEEGYRTVQRLDWEKETDLLVHYIGK